MAIITVSRGTFSGGKMLAECLSKRLGYRCVDREILAARISGRGVSAEELRAALRTPPSIGQATLNHRKYIYLALMQAEIAEEIRAGDAIYHGLVGHLLLRSDINILRLRVIAPMESRVRMARERLGIGREEALAHIGRMDEDRGKWTSYLYGVGWEDPSLYDVVINLQQISAEQACRMVSGMTREEPFGLSEDQRARLDDFALASRLRAALASDPLTGNLEVEVDGCAATGVVTVNGDLFEQNDDVRRVALSVPGVKELVQQAPAD